MARSLKKSGFKWLLGVCLGISLLGGLSMATLVWLAPEFSQRDQQDDFTAAQLEDWLGLKLPANINTIHSYSETWQGSRVFIRIHFPAQSLSGFVAVNGFVPVDLESSQLNFPQPHQAQAMNGWNLEAELELAGGTVMAYGIPAQSGNLYGATAQGFYFPTVIVIPTEKDYLWLYLYGLKP